MSTSDRKFILALDEGTTNTKAFLVDEAGSIVKEAARPVSIAYPQPAWVEQDAWEIWRTYAGGRGPGAWKACPPGS